MERQRVDVLARQHMGLRAPMSVYEVHLGSWRRDATDPRRLMGYREIAAPLIEHVSQCGFTHVDSCL